MELSEKAGETALVKHRVWTDRYLTIPGSHVTEWPPLYSQRHSLPLFFPKYFDLFLFPPLIPTLTKKVLHNPKTYFPRVVPSPVSSNAESSGMIPGEPLQWALFSHLAQALIAAVL